MKLGLTPRLYLQAPNEECDTERELLRKTGLQLGDLSERKRQDDDVCQYVGHSVSNLNPLNAETFCLDPGLPRGMNWVALESLSSVVQQLRETQWDLAHFLRTYQNNIQSHGPNRNRGCYEVYRDPKSVANGEDS